jgi:hypothetical protein
MQANNANLAARLQAASAEQRTKLKDDFIVQMRGELDRLVTLLSAKEFEKANRIDPASAEYHAVEILQFARYPDAAQLFVEHLDTRSTAFPTVSDERQAHFPFFPFAVGAAAIGVPALSALTAGIVGTDGKSTRFQLCCLVVKEILGEELALSYVADLAKNNPPLRDNQRMEEASRLIRTRTNTWNAIYCSDYAAR